MIVEQDSRGVKEPRHSTAAWYAARSIVSPPSAPGNIPSIQSSALEIKQMKIFGVSLESDEIVVTDLH